MPFFSVSTPWSQTFFEVFFYLYAYFFAFSELSICTCTSVLNSCQDAAIFLFHDIKSSMRDKNAEHRRLLLASQNMTRRFSLFFLFLASCCKAASNNEHQLQRVALQNTHDSFSLDAVPSPNPAVWERPKECLPSIPEPEALSMPGFDEISQDLARDWLRKGPFDNDTMLGCRLDGANDQVGRLMDSMLLRLRLHQAGRATKRVTRNSVEETSKSDSKILFDARSLQMEGYANRGIGLYAKDALDNLRGEIANHNDIVLLVDPVQADLPAEVRRNHRCVSSVDEAAAHSYGALIQPSPMTSSPAPLLALLRRKDVVKVAIVFDFIPAHHADVYLPTVTQRAEYAVALDALLLYYDQYISISHTTQRELKKMVAVKLEEFSIEKDTRGLAFPRTLRQSVRFQVALPSRITDIRMKKTLPRDARDGSIVIMTGMDPRKNTIGALAAVHLSRAPQTATIRVIGMSAQDNLVKTWCASLGVPSDRVQVLGRVDDHEKETMIQKASLVIVPSFDEGLSLPVIEALTQGTPVVASAITSHEELVGSDDFLASPKHVSELAQAIDVHYGRVETVKAQRQHYLRQNYVSLGRAIALCLSDRSFFRSNNKRHAIKGARKHFASSEPSSISQNSKDYTAASASALSPKARRRLNIGIATPWPPQQSGIADFSRAVVPDLARRAQVTVYVTSSASSQVPAGFEFQIKPAPHLLKIERNAHAHDVLIVVLGNSHFHLSFLRLLHHHDCHVIAHDTRMVNVYLALQGEDGLRALMNKSVDARKQRKDVSITDQMANFDLLQNLGYGDIARLAKTLYMHTSLVSGRIAKETGLTPKILPFPVYLHGIPDDLSAEARQAARAALGFSKDCFHVSTFGSVDYKYKQVDKLISAAAIASSDNYSVCLHLIGTVIDQDRAEKEKEQYNREGSLLRLDYVGRVSGEQYVQYMLATQLGVQLRSNPLLGISGSLSDLAAIGTPAIGSRGLCREIDAPEYIEEVPDNASAEDLATQIQQHLSKREEWRILAKKREEYVQHMSIDRYNKLLLEDFPISS